MRQNIKIMLLIVVILALVGVSSAYLLFTPQYNSINMSGYSLEVPKADMQVQQISENYNKYDDKTHNLTIKSWAWKNINDTNTSSYSEIAEQLKNHSGQNCSYDNVSMVNQSGTYTYYTNDESGSILVITSNNLDEMTHMIKSIKQTNVTLPVDVNSTNITVIKDINTLIKNDTNDTNDQDTQSTTKTTKSTKSTKKSSSSSSDDIPSEGTYNGVDYSLHQGGYPYYSPQAGRTYYSKAEEYAAMKESIDSGIAD